MMTNYKDVIPMTKIKVRKYLILKRYPYSISLKLWRLSKKIGNFLLFSKSVFGFANKTRIKQGQTVHKLHISTFWDPHNYFGPPGLIHTRFSAILENINFW